MPDAATANLALPLMAAAQAQKHVTHNEALVALDTLAQLAVLDKDLTAPDRKSTRLNSSHSGESRMPSSA